MLSSCFITLAAVIAVNAHGYIGVLDIAGKQYKGISPYAESGTSAIRQLTGVEPVQDMTDVDLACGLGSKPATQMVEAMPGDQVKFGWVAGEYGPWPHSVGPMQTYLAECGGDCKTAVAQNLNWFKIQETGKLADGTWEQKVLVAGQPAVINLPSNLKAGDYLMRHEVLSLQNAMSEGGAEFFVNCVQMSVKGTGTGSPTAQELVKLPGAYTAQDKGIHYDAYAESKGDYIFPGPLIAAFVNAGATNTTSPAPLAPSAPVTGTPTFPAGTPIPTAPTGPTAPTVPATPKFAGRAMQRVRRR